MVLWMGIGNSRVHASLVLMDWNARFNRCASWADANIGLTVLIGADEVLVVVGGMVDPSETVSLVPGVPMA
jgi:hypothetical protein